MDYAHCRFLLFSFILLAGCAESEAPSVVPDPAIDSVRSWVDSVDRSEDTDDGQQVPPVAQMIDGLVAKLQADPKDRQGWELLARSYAFVGDLDQARAASKRAVALGSEANDIDAMVADAEINTD
ncbi:MAG: hypothetical protein AAF417_10220 [Pseudomonadota bacterium]